MGRRCREDIINEILDVSKNGVRKTQMMRRTNISFGQTRVYLPY
jgi:predicted transcriptional regulator